MLSFLCAHFGIKPGTDAFSCFNSEKIGTNVNMHLKASILALSFG